MQQLFDVFTKVAQRGVDFEYDGKSLSIDNGPWDSLSALLLPKLGINSHNANVSRFFFETVGNKIGFVIGYYESDNPHEKSAEFKPVPIKGFFNNSFVKSLKLFDPAKVAQLKK